MSSFENLTKLLERFVKAGPPGCACSVSHKGELLYSNYLGYADLESNKPISEETIYRIYSMTKVVTCTAALMLYERGLFTLNDPLEEYLPEYKGIQVARRSANGTISYSPAANPIRIKDLFTMSSGLTYGGVGSETARQTQQVLEDLRRKQAEENQPYGIRDLARALAGVPLAFEPGTHWNYGFSHDVLGALIEVISGKTFGQFLREEIFAPLGMKDTFFRIPEDERGRLCSIYNRSDDGALTKNTKLDANFEPTATFESGGGGLLSTLTDYTRFAQMLASGGTLDGERILGRKTLQLMASNHLSGEQLADYNWPYLAGYGYGLGVRVMIDPQAGGSNGATGEFGWCGYAGTWVLVDPSEELCAVYMQQMIPNFEEIHQPRLRAVIYGSL